MDGALSCRGYSRRRPNDTLEAELGRPVKARYDFLDWLRVIAIFVLLLYHTGMMFVGWGWHIVRTPRRFAGWHGRWTSRIDFACRCCSSSPARGCGSR